MGMVELNNALFNSLISSLFFGVACLHGPSLKGATIVKASRKGQDNAWEQPATYHAYEHMGRFHLRQGYGPQDIANSLSASMNDKPTKWKNIGNVCKTTEVGPSR